MAPQYVKSVRNTTLIILEYEYRESMCSEAAHENAAQRHRTTFLSR
jgi:hypothetical protein